MADRSDLLVEGYCFGSQADAERAQTEKKKADYFASRLADKSAQNILAVYNRILDEKVFVTPTGWEYLKKLQEQLRSMGVEEEKIRQIPLFVTFVHEEEKVVRQRVIPKKKRDTARDAFRISALINIVLAIMVGVMFFIAVKSDNPNIINYRNRIVSEYATWEQELTEREKAVKKKEAELGLEAIPEREAEAEEETIFEE
ncbi:MAG: hypothetical protein NC400_07160 [Clostridium sp.]|nr:hypothetical protein [Clostridium sp.]